MKSDKKVCLVETFEDQITEFRAKFNFCDVLNGKRCKVFSKKKKLVKSKRSKLKSKNSFLTQSDCFCYSNGIPLQSVPKEVHNKTKT